MKYILFVLLLFTAIQMNSPVVAQQSRSAVRQPNNSEKQQFRLAQRFIRNRDYRNAIRILENLYRQIPGYEPYYRELFNAYLQLSELDKAVTLIEKQSEGKENTADYQIDRANLTFRQGEKEKARQMWQEILDKYGDDVRIYTETASAMLANRLFSEAIGVYQSAYQKHPHQHFLLRDIAGFYRRQLNYTAATKAYVQYIRRDPVNHQFAIRQVLSFDIEEPQVDSLAIILNSAMKEKGDNQEKLYLLTAKFYQKHRRFEDALQILLRLADMEKDERYLFEFARSLQSDEEFAVALSAFDRIIKEFPKSKFLLHSYLGAATCNLELAKAGNDQAYARRSLEMIEAVRQKHPAHPQIGDLTLLEGDIQRQFFFDLDRAAQIYVSVAERFSRQLKLRESAWLKAGETQMMRGDLARAREHLQKVQTEVFLPQAQLLLAHAHFFEGDYPAAGEDLNKILQMEGLSGDLTNDVLSLQSNLSLAAEAPQALESYAEASWLTMQRKLPQALNSLKKVLDSNPPAHFKIEVLLEAANLAAESGHVDEALAFCEQILQDETLSLYADQALFTMAAIVENRLQDYARAYRLYDQVLRDHSRSSLANAARDRLKSIRENHPEVVDETAM